MSYWMREISVEHKLEANLEFWSRETSDHFCVYIPVSWKLLQVYQLPHHVCVVFTHELRQLKHQAPLYITVALHKRGHEKLTMLDKQNMKHSYIARPTPSKNKYSLNYIQNHLSSRDTRKRLWTRDIVAYR